MQNLPSLSAQTGKYAPAADDQLFVFRPARPEDVPALLDMHRRLSQETLYSRYMIPAPPAHLHSHLHQITSYPDGLNATWIVQQDDQIIGLGYFVVKPDRPDVAEPALLIEDRFQGRGLGTQLLNRLIVAARDQGICYFDVVTLPANRRMMNLLHRAGQSVHSEFDGLLVNLMMTIPGGNNS